MEHGKHLIRAFLILLTAGIILFALRFVEKPDTFGDIGHYRASNLTEQRAIPAKHGPTDACAECHNDMVAVKQAGGHRSLACEGCHAPLSTHIQDGDYLAEMPQKKVAALCLTCHRQLEGRPKSQPQVVVEEHLSDMGEEWRIDVCYDCHNPHDPGEMPE